MQVGTLVRMIGEPHGILGIITEMLEDWDRDNKMYYKVSWIGDLELDTTYADEEVLEVVCK